MSFNPIDRLTADSARSPIGPNTLTTAASAMPDGMVRGSSRPNLPTMRPASRVMTVAPRNPSRVLLGERCGARRRLPKARP